jgi:hypothetical protein
LASNDVHAPVPASVEPPASVGSPERLMLLEPVDPVELVELLTELLLAPPELDELELPVVPPASVVWPELLELPVEVLLVPPELDEFELSADAPASVASSELLAPPVEPRLVPPELDELEPVAVFTWLDMVELEDFEALA